MAGLPLPASRKRSLKTSQRGIFKIRADSFTACREASLGARELNIESNKPAAETWVLSASIATNRVEVNCILNFQFLVFFTYCGAPGKIWCLYASDQRLHFGYYANRSVSRLGGHFPLKSEAAILQGMLTPFITMLPDIYTHADLKQLQNSS